MGKQRQGVSKNQTNTKMVTGPSTMLGIRPGPIKCISLPADNRFQLLLKLGQIRAAGTTHGAWAPHHSPQAATALLHRTPSWFPAGKIGQLKRRHHMLLLSCPAQMTPNTPPSTYTRTTPPDSTRSTCHFGRFIRPSSVTCLFSNFWLTFFLVK